MAGGDVVTCHSWKRTDFCRIWRDPHSDSQGGKLMFLNYPNNPTGAVADLGSIRT